MLEPVVSVKQHAKVEQPGKVESKQQVVKEEAVLNDAAPIAGTVSGASTPVHSNAVSTEKILEGANKALLGAKLGQMGMTEAGRAPNATTSAYTTASPIPTQQRTDDIKRLPQPQQFKSSPSLMEQLNRAVALKGEKAVMGLLEKLENPSSLSYNTTLTPRGRSMDLLSSIGAPLTPRSRPSSPERWNNPPISEKKNRTAPFPKGEKMDQSHIMEAVKIISNEYETESGNFFVRKPNSSNFDYNFFSPESTYRETFDVDNPESLEVIAHIEADGSVFALIGKDARHGNDEGEEEKELLNWNVFENVEETARVLGSVTYIDMEGNEREYWLGECWMRRE
jgi:hypothetical protein